MKKSASVAVATLALLSTMASPASATITWTLRDVTTSAVSNIAACNDGVLHRLVPGAGAYRNLQFALPSTSGTLAWTNAVAVPSDGQITCAGGPYSIYDNTITFLGTAPPLAPMCVDLGGGIVRCVYADNFGVGPAVSWNYWYDPRNISGYASLPIFGTGATETHSFDRSAVVQFVGTTATVRATSNGAALLSGNLFAARRVASSVQGGRRVVFAVNTDNTFWMNQESAPGTLNLNPGGAWHAISSPFDFDSALLAANLVDFEAAVVNGRLTLYALMNFNGSRWIYSGVIS